MNCSALCTSTILTSSEYYKLTLRASLLRLRFRAPYATLKKEYWGEKSTVIEKEWRKC